MKRFYFEPSKALAKQLTSNITFVLVTGPICPNNVAMNSSVTERSRFPTYLEKREKINFWRRKEENNAQVK